VAVVEPVWLPLVVTQGTGYYREEALDMQPILMIMTASLANLALLWGKRRLYFLWKYPGMSPSWL